LKLSAHEAARLYEIFHLFFISRRLVSGVNCRLQIKHKKLFFPLRVLP
jgi:hypothetical protein